MEMTKTYTTSQVAEIAGVHPNTVRLYEEWGLIPKPERKANGYRVFTELHVRQMLMARKALQTEVIHGGLRAQIIEVIKLSAQYEPDQAIKKAEKYIEAAEQETENAREAANLCQELFRSTPVAVSDSVKTFRRAEAARRLGVTIDTIRNWEMNGLITVKRKSNGYRIYDENDMKRLKVIKTLRCAGYSLSAILRMLNRLENRTRGYEEIFTILNTPEEDEDIISACDKLVDSLQDAIENAHEVIEMLEKIKEMI